MTSSTMHTFLVSLDTPLQVIFYLSGRGIYKVVKTLVEQVVAKGFVANACEDRSVLLADGDDVICRHFVVVDDVGCSCANMCGSI